MTHPGEDPAQKAAAEQFAALLQDPGFREYMGRCGWAAEEMMSITVVPAVEGTPFGKVLSAAMDYAVSVSDPRVKWGFIAYQDSEAEYGFRLVNLGYVTPL